jgi:4-hydroxythreonine-4-phosphate dehydrogenase
LTLGEPAGIGPDLTIQLWRRRVELRLPAFYLIADLDFIKQRARLLDVDIALSVVTPAQAGETFARGLPIAPLDTPATAAPGKPDASSAPAAIASIRRAVADVLAGKAAAIVTNPVAKNVLYCSGFAEPGHTEFLAKLVQEATSKAMRPVMMLWSPELAVVPVTIHLPLKDVVTQLSSELVAETGQIVAHDLTARFGISRPRIVVAGLNARRRRWSSWRRGWRNRGAGGETATGRGHRRCRALPADTLFHERARATYDVALCISTRR